jgi:hypothetical protein
VLPPVIDGDGHRAVYERGYRFPNLRSLVFTIDENTEEHMSVEVMHRRDILPTSLHTLAYEGWEEPNEFEYFADIVEACIETLRTLNLKGVQIRSEDAEKMRLTFATIENLIFEDVKLTANDFRLLLSSGVPNLKNISVSGRLYFSYFTEVVLLLIATLEASPRSSLVTFRMEADYEGYVSPETLDIKQLQDARAIDKLKEWFVSNLEEGKLDALRNVSLLRLRASEYDHDKIDRAIAERQRVTAAKEVEENAPDRTALEIVFRRRRT